MTPEQLEELLKKHGIADDKIKEIVADAKPDSQPDEGNGEEPLPPDGEDSNNGEDGKVDGQEGDGNPVDGEPKPDDNANDDVPPAPNPENQPNPNEGNEGEVPPANEPAPVDGSNPEGNGDPQPDVPPVDGNPQPTPPEPVSGPDLTNYVTKDELNEALKANEGLSAELKALKEALVKSGVLVGDPNPQVGLDRGGAPDDRAKDEDWNSLLDELNGRR